VKNKGNCEKNHTPKGYELLSSCFSLEAVENNMDVNFKLLRPPAAQEVCCWELVEQKLPGSSQFSLFVLFNVSGVHQLL